MQEEEQNRRQFAVPLSLIFRLRKNDMYTPPHFSESRLSILHDFIRKQPLAAIVASAAHGLNAEHVPLLLDESRGHSGVLQGHVAQANPIWHSLEDGADVLVLFQGAQHYVSPNWYPSKQEHGRVVPTWNYTAVHARGRIKWNRERNWLRELLERTTNFHEQTQPHPWRLMDAPLDFVERMLESIVGFEIAISSLTGKWKLSQNRSAEDRAGVIRALEAESSSEATGVANCMREID